MSAEANSDTEPKTKPNPGPNAKPPRMSTAQMGSIPATPAPSGRNAAMTAERTPSRAIDLASMAPSANCARTTTNTKGTSSAKKNGASVA